jgi:hypothetical protein
VSDDLDAAIAEVGDVDALAEVAGEAIDLDALLEEGGEGGCVEDAVVHGLSGVDDELWEEDVRFYAPTQDSRFERTARAYPYLLGDLRALLGAALVSSAAGSGVLLHVGLSILLSSLLRMCVATSKNFFSCLRAPSGQSRRGSCTAKRDTYRSLHHFVGI